MVNFYLLFLLILQSIIYHPISCNSDQSPNFTESPRGKNIQEKPVLPYSDYIDLEYVKGGGYCLSVTLGGQKLLLSLNTTVCGILLFEDGKKICVHDDKTRHCYIAGLSSTATWCNNTDACMPGNSVFDCKEVDSPKSIDDITKTVMRIEGLDYAIYTLEGSENVKVNGTFKYTTDYFEKAPIKLARTYDQDDNLELLSNTDGLFGIAGFDLTCRNRSIWSEMLKDHNGYFALDINGTNEASQNRVYFGMNRFESFQVAWSERRQIGGIYNNSLLEFTIYDLEMCGVGVFGKTSSNWEVVIDLSSESLVLPGNFWMTVMTYLPVDESCFKSEDPLRYCYIKDGISTDHLPGLKFKLQQFGKEEITIPIENLIVKENGRNRLCIVPDNHRDKPYTIIPTIRFGHKVLESLLVLVDTKGYKLGLIHKSSTGVSNIKCKPKKQCIGDQIYEPALNYCLDPNCSVWLFKKFNVETGQCETPVWIKVLLTLIVIVLASIEFYCHYARKHIIHIASNLCQ